MENNVFWNLFYETYEQVMSRINFHKESIDLQGCTIDLSYFTMPDATLYGVSIHIEKGFHQVPLFATIFFKNEKLERGDVSFSLEKDYPGLLDHIQDTHSKLNKMKVFL